MVETETKNVVQSAVESVLKAVRARKEKISPERIDRVVSKLLREQNRGASPAKEAQAGKIVGNAKQIFEEAKANGQHVTTGMREWAKSNRFEPVDPDPAQALAIARKDLDIVMKAADIAPDSWIAKAAPHVKSAEGAQALSAVALAPKDVRENPHFLFQTAAQLAVSNSNPEAQSTIKAFIAEMSNLQGKDGFQANEDVLYQLLTEQGMGARPTPPPATPEEFQGVDFSKLPPQAKRLLSALRDDLAAAGVDKMEQFRVLNSYDEAIANIDTSSFKESQYKTFSHIMREKAKLGSEVSPSRGVSRDWFETNAGIKPVGEGDFHARGLSLSQVKDILAEPDSDGDSGVDKYINNMMRRIFSSSREPRSPDLQEQTEYWEIEQLFRHVFGEEKAQAKLAEMREKWEAEYRRNAISWHMIRGGSPAKDLIMKYAEGIPPDTLTHEKSIMWAPQAIAAFENVEFEIGAETRYVFDQGRRWFDQSSTSAHGHNRLEAFLEGKLTGSELAEALEWKKKTGVSITMDEHMQCDAEAFSKLASLHHRIDRAYEQAKLSNPRLSEQAFYTTYNTAHPEMVTELKAQWADFMNYDHPEDFIGAKLWNTETLNKWQGFSPIQIRAMIKLEAQLKADGVTGLDSKTWKMARAVSAATRYQVGTYRTVTLTHNLANMPGLLVEPSGSDVMIAGAQEQLGRIEKPGVFARRFSFAGENVGLPIWSNIISGQLEKIGVVLKPGDKMMPSQKESEDFFMRRARTLLLKARAQFGSGFTELVRPEPLSNLSSFDGTTWRIEKAVSWVLQAKYGEHAKNVAHGIQLQLNSKDIAKKIEIWGSIAKRTPSKLMQLMSTDRTDGVLETAGMTPGNTEWQKFMGVLGIVEKRLNSIDANILNDAIDLGDKRHFDTFFTDDVFRAFGIQDPAEQARLKTEYLKIIQEFQSTFLTGKPPGEARTYREIWAKNNLTINVSMVDFDVGLARWDKLPADQQLRRVVSDATPHMEASNSTIKIMTTPELSTVVNQRKLIEEYGILKAAVNGYLDGHAGEGAVLDIDDAIVTFREAQDFYKAARVIPGASMVFRQLAGLDTQKWWARGIASAVRPGLNFIANSWFFVRDPEERRVFQEILKRDIKEWPKSFAQLHLSPAIAAIGPSAAAEDALDAHEHYELLEHSGLITQEHDRLNRLKDKHGARILPKLAAVGQRYWWVPLTATVAVGTIIALQEQGMDSGGKSH